MTLLEAVVVGLVVPVLEVAVVDCDVVAVVEVGEVDCEVVTLDVTEVV